MSRLESNLGGVENRGPAVRSGHARMQTCDVLTDVNHKIGPSKKGKAFDKECYQRVGSVNNRRQPQVFAHLLDGNLVTWRSKKQTVVTRSRAEVEFRDVAHEMCKLL
ncbi:hypothetical protein CK203_082628 [Vitis vinifera]|uniref:Mitochondrial protein n=1 Tax=Vitis vinifera TaxID=29760 RepID=A0A438BWT0_VITVI|nr:hypothetical protein CK203_082628 [Vitis vinifera]